MKNMIGRGLLLLAGILLTSIPSLAAQGESAMLGYVGKKSFWMNVPAGWTQDVQAAKRFGAVFVLVPPGVNFNNAGAVVIGSSYANTVVADAASKMKSEVLSADAAAMISDLPALEVGSTRITQIGIRSAGIKSQPFETVAFIQLGQDVLVVTLSGLAEAPYNRAGSVLAEMLKSYSEAGLEVTRETPTRDGSSTKME